MTEKVRNKKLEIKRVTTLDKRKPNLIWVDLYNGQKRCKKSTNPKLFRKRYPCFASQEARILVGRKYHFQMYRPTQCKGPQGTAMVVLVLCKMH